MRFELPFATHHGPADLVVKPTGSMKPELEVSPYRRVLPEGTVSQNPWVVGQLGVRALDGLDAYTFSDEILKDRSLLEAARCHCLLIEHGFADRPLELLLLHRELGMVVHTLA